MRAALAACQSKLVSVGAFGAVGAAGSTFGVAEIPHGTLNAQIFVGGSPDGLVRANSTWQTG